MEGVVVLTDFEYFSLRKEVVVILIGVILDNFHLEEDVLIL